tara:strand:+ start:381 stop:1292 length:912 start_codon:yes stop_codon:yes gene_type:complete
MEIEDTLNINPDGSAKIDIKMNLDKSTGAEMLSNYKSKNTDEKEVPVDTIYSSSDALELINEYTPNYDISPTNIKYVREDGIRKLSYTLYFRNFQDYKLNVESFTDEQQSLLVNYTNNMFDFLSLQDDQLIAQEKSLLKDKPLLAKFIEVDILDDRNRLFKYRDADKLKEVTIEAVNEFIEKEKMMAGMIELIPSFTINRTYVFNGKIKSVKNMSKLKNSVSFKFDMQSFMDIISHFMKNEEKAFELYKTCFDLDNNAEKIMNQFKYSNNFFATFKVKFNKEPLFNYYQSLMDDLNKLKKHSN